jgi:hypothetical protein
VTGSFVNTSYPPRRLDVEGWGLLSPGERADGVEPGSEHNKALEAEGDLTRAYDAKKKEN